MGFTYYKRRKENKLLSWRLEFLGKFRSCRMEHVLKTLSWRVLL